MAREEKAREAALHARQIAEQPEDHKSDLSSRRCHLLTWRAGTLAHDQSCGTGSHQAAPRDENHRLAGGEKGS